MSEFARKLVLVLGASGLFVLGLLRILEVDEDPLQGQLILVWFAAALLLPIVGKKARKRIW